jgi:hypothetical protein
MALVKKRGRVVAAGVDEEASTGGSSASDGHACIGRQRGCVRQAMRACTCKLDFPFIYLFSIGQFETYSNPQYISNK